MKIKNLTTREQKLDLVDLAGGRDYSIYVRGNAVTEIVGAYIPRIEKIKGIFEIIGETPVEVVPAVSINSDIVEESGEPDVQETEEDEEETPSIEGEDDSIPQSPSTDADSFVCDLCGAEFASARGLSSHKNRTHPEE